uniref:Uncharacterized protein n=1 Tax=Scylla olivacea TaxID=85551 RepID=A0A0P4VV97_SCYOL
MNVTNQSITSTPPSLPPQDSPWMGTFHYLRRGFIEKPTDFYGRPFMMASEKEIGGPGNSRGHYCQGNVLSIKVREEGGWREETGRGRWREETGRRWREETRRERWREMICISSALHRNDCNEQMYYLVPCSLSPPLT